MNILFCKSGNPKSGSWQIRGIQIAQALREHDIPAHAVVDPSDGDLEWANAIIIVKSCDGRLALRLRHTYRKPPIIWDALDFWQQPQDNIEDRQKAIDGLMIRWRQLKPAAVVATTNAMARDLGDFPTQAIIRHHARPITLLNPLNPIRPAIHAIGYEGSARYLEGGWFAAIGKCAERRGIPFIVNPSRLADVDVVFAVRGGPWRGYQTDNWKSNVKLANAQHTGTPFIGLPEAGCTETQSGAEEWVNEPDEAEGALRTLESADVRQDRSRRLRAAVPRLDTILKQYVELCSQLAR